MPENIQQTLAGPTTFCPFKAPSRSLAPFGHSVASIRRFDQRPGMSLVCAELPVSPNLEPAEWPIRSFLQIVFVALGELDFGWAQKPSQRLKAGEWLLIKPATQTCCFRAACPSQLLWIECDALASQSLVGFANTLASPLQDPDTPHLANGSTSGRLQSLGVELAQSQGDGPRERLLIESKTLEWLALLLDHPVFSPCRAIVPRRNERDEAALRAAAHLLETRLGEEHSITQLSRAVHLNEFKLKKGFRERYQTTVIGYLRQKRMERARELLANGGQSVIEIANSVGYSNPSHFARAFRESFGINPSEIAAHGT